MRPADEGAIGNVAMHTVLTVDYNILPIPAAAALASCPEPLVVVKGDAEAD